MISQPAKNKLDDHTSGQFQEFELPQQQQDAILGGGAFNDAVAKAGNSGVPVGKPLTAANKTRR